MQLTRRGHRARARPVRTCVRRGGPVLDNVIQEIDVATGRLLFEWHSVGNVGLGESHDRRPDDGSQFDYFHMNAVEDGARRRPAHLGAQHLRAVRDRPGDRARSTGARRQAQRLPARARARASAASTTRAGPATGVITLFDNRIAAPTERRPVAGDQAARRRAPAHACGSCAATSTRAGLGAPNKGGARMQPNGNLLVGWGAVPAITEFTPARPDRVRRAVRGRRTTAPTARSAPTGSACRRRGRTSRPSGAAGASRCGRAGTGRPRSRAGRCSAATRRTRSPRSARRPRGGFETALQRSAARATWRCARSTPPARCSGPRRRYALASGPCGSSGRSRCGRGRAASTSSPTRSCRRCRSCASCGSASRTCSSATRRPR